MKDDMSSIILGENTVLPTDDSGNQNVHIATSYTLISSATIQSLSFYVTSGAAGKMRLGIYDNSAGSPNNRKAFTGEITLVNGWNTAVVTVPILLSAGTHWITYLYNNSGINFKNTNTGTSKYHNMAYAALPDPFGSIDGSYTAHWSHYGTLTVIDTVKDLMNNLQSGFLVNTPVYDGGILHLRRKV